MMSFGLILAAGAALAFTVSLAIQKMIMEQNSAANPIEICLVVGIVKWIGSEAVRIYNRQPYKLSTYSTKTKTLIIVNQLATVPSYILCALSVQHISMGVAMMIGNLAPFIVALLSLVLLSEPTKTAEMINMVICFICVAGVITYRNNDQPQQGDNSKVILGVLYSLLSVMLFSITYIVARYIRNIHYSIVTSMNIGTGMILYMIVYALYVMQQYNATGSVSFSLGLRDLILSCLSGITGVVCSLMFTAASQIELASRVAQLDFMEVVFGYVIDLLLFGTSVSIVEIIGCVAITLGGVSLFFLTRDESAPESFSVTIKRQQLKESLLP